MKYSMLTTTDNPYNPKTDWDKWFKFDIIKGHNTCQLLDKVVVSSDSLPMIDQIEAIDFAIDEIIKTDPEHIFKKLVFEEEFEGEAKPS